MPANQYSINGVISTSKSSTPVSNFCLTVREAGEVNTSPPVADHCPSPPVKSVLLNPVAPPSTIVTVVLPANPAVACVIVTTLEAAVAEKNELKFIRKKIK